MFKFKVGDKVKVKANGMSGSGRIYSGKIGTILRRNGPNSYGNYYSLDIDIRHGGIYEEELQLVGKGKLDLSYIKPYGIVAFMEGAKK